MLSIIATVSTVMVTITFVAIVIWAWSGKRKQEFDDAANLPFDENTTERD
jgi:cytochrome c oxidase cbb3-type subunit 4